MLAPFVLKEVFALDMDKMGQLRYHYLPEALIITIYMDPVLV